MIEKETIANRTGFELSIVPSLQKKSISRRVRRVNRVIHRMAKKLKDQSQSGLVSGRRAEGKEGMKETGRIGKTYQGEVCTLL